MRSFFQKYGVTIYVLLLSMHLYAQILGEVYATVQFITKAALLPTLILFLLAQDVWKNLPQNKWFIIIALTGSFMGDVLLTSDNYFIAGMIAFMITHVFNIMYWNQLTPSKGSKMQSVYLVALLFLSFCAFIYLQLHTSMGSLIYPVLVYMILICTAAIKAFRATLNEGAKWVAQLFWFPGMLFFICSDTVLAFNKFNWSIHHPIKHIGLVTMLTYGVAQLLIVKGYEVYLKNTVAKP